MRSSSQSAEQMLISSILRDTDMAVALREGVTADMFYGYKDEWDWIADYYMRHGKVPSKPVFKRVYPGFPIRPVNDTAHLSEEVRRLHAHRSMVASMKHTSQLLSEGDVDAALAYQSKQLLGVASAIGVYNDSDIFSDNQDITDELDRIITRAEETGSAGIPMGFKTFDDRTGGAKPGELVTVGARLGVGKSWVLTKWAANAAALGYRVQYDSLEMSRPQVAFRMYSLLAEQGEALFRNTDLMKGVGIDRKLLSAFLTKLKTDMQGLMHISDRSRGKVTPLTVAAQIERNKPDIVFIDYITLMATTDGREKNWAGIGELSGELKGLAMQYNIPVVVAAQLNRERGIGKRGEPAGPEALAQSDMIGQDSDTVVTMADPSESVRAMRCVKSRHGKSNFKWYTEFNPGEGRFHEITYEKSLVLQDQDADNADAE